MMFQWNKKLYFVFHKFPKQGKDLAARDANGLSDPYVRITLLPDKKVFLLFPTLLLIFLFITMISPILQHRLETKIKRRTLNPKWNETFYFEGNSLVSSTRGAVSPDWPNMSGFRIKQ